MQIIKRELEKISTELISEDEYSKVLKKTLANFIFREEKTSERAANYYANKIILGKKITDYRETIKKYEAVTKEDIMETAKIIFSKSPKIGILTKSLKKEEIVY